MTGIEGWGVYVHVPWCRVRCPYCAFTIVPLRDAPVPDPVGYTDAVLRQWDAVAAHFPGRPTTVAFGGGTPSLHPLPEIARLVRTLAPLPGAEITLEANPEDVDPRWLDGVLEAGITRLSLGVQTFQRAQARLLSRAHTAPTALAVLGQVAAAGFESWSLDLIFAVPGQDRAALDRDLDQVAASGAPHVSLYGLTAEPDTPYTRAVTEGRLVPPNDEDWRAAYDHARERLGAMGLAQYEVSNHAARGHRSRHNQLYWRVSPWAGLGLAAHGRLPDGTRTVSSSDPAAFRADPTTFSEWWLPTPLDQAEELLISCLRHVDGLSLDRLAELAIALPEGAWRPLVQEGLATCDGATLVLSPAGLPLTDALVGHLAMRLEPVTPAAGREPPA